MALPPLAPIAPANIRLSLAPEEWTACLEAWIALAELTVQLPASDFVSESKASQASLPIFLRSLYRESSHASPTDETLRGPQALRLQKAGFRLVYRILTEGQPDDTLLDWDFQADFCHVHVKSSALPRLMRQLWKEQRTKLESICQSYKSNLTAKLESQSSEGLVLELQRLAPVLRASPDAALMFMTGSDLLDALVSLYGRSPAVDDRKAIVIILYLGLESLVQIEPQNVSLLSDHLYSLKASADAKGSHKDSLLSDLVTNTPLVSRLRRSVSGKSADRLSKLLDILDTYRSSSIARPRKRIRRKVGKGKGKAPLVDGELHMHRMSLVSQVQDLFPDLGAGFVMKLLDEYNDDAEQVTAHLLDGTLPPHLQILDRTEEAPLYDQSSQAQIDHLAPKSTPLQPTAPSYIPTRRNVFDDDELDRLEMDTSRLHLGKNERAPSRGNQPNKSAILSALAAFDSDDDERDDTYDVDDVGGTVDTAHPDGEPGPAAKVTREENDAALFKVYKSSPELFGRTFDVRRGQARQALKAETGMTDEAIEGWAIMLQRDPKRLSRLESRFGIGGAGGFDGKQTELGRTSYRESPDNTGTEDSDAPGSGRGGLRGGRGRGRGGRARGGGRGGISVAGSSNDAGTAQAQRRKEENKGSRANHNRRDQRARKMARGGFPG